MESSEDRLQAFCSITIDECFVVRDLKIIDGSSGPFVAMPSRKLSGHCQKCHHKNHLRAHFCNNCGSKQNHAGPVPESPHKLYADVAHPINSRCREMIQNAVIEEFEAELNRSRQPGYRSRYDDEFSDEASPSRDTADTAAAAVPVPIPTAAEPVDTSDKADDLGTGDPDDTMVRGDSKPETKPGDKDGAAGDKLGHKAAAAGDKSGASGDQASPPRRPRVPRPHFLDERSDSSSSSTGGNNRGNDNDQDSFGAGIF